MARWQPKIPANDFEVRNNQCLVQSSAYQPNRASAEPYISPLFLERYRQGMKEGDQDFLTKILDYVAIACLPQGNRSRISHHLFKVRLVNKQLADAAATVFKTRLQDPKFDHYAVIILPQQRLDVLSCALGPNSAFYRCASALKLCLYRTQPSAITFAAFEEQAVDAIKGLEDTCDLNQQELYTLYRLNYIHAMDQERFLIDLHPSRLVATIRSIVRWLPEAFEMSIVQPFITEELIGTSNNIEVDDWLLWHAFSDIDGMSVASLHSDMRIITELLPSFPLHKTRNLTISTHGDCFPFDAGYSLLSVPQRTLSEAHNLAALRSLTIHWRTEDRNVFNGHWNHLLKRRTYLERLTLQAAEFFSNDDGYVEDVMEDVKLPYLETFGVVNLETTLAQLFAFFVAHKDALNEVDIIGEQIKDGLPFFLLATKLAGWSNHFTLTITEYKNSWEGNDELMQKYGQYMRINTELHGSPRNVSDCLL